MLTLIGLGLADLDDMTLKGKKAIDAADLVYFETYTSKPQYSLQELKQFFGKKITPVGRAFVEEAKQLLAEAKYMNVALLVIGDPLCATTHVSLLLEAKQQGVTVQIVHNASIVSAIGAIGLEVYKFGKITSIPFENKDVTAPVDVFHLNYSNNLHTLFLLDLQPERNKFMTVHDALTYLTSNGLKKDLLCVGCAGIGSQQQDIRAGTIQQVLRHTFRAFPQCLVIPAPQLHFIEEEAIQMWQ